ncbi:MAG TPA: glycosyltransferase family 4 protein [Solirubrobacteraceae bacterium]|jgi:glycosyltransferase involved in cell wall biosynthesis
MTSSCTQSRPVLFVTGHAPPDRVGAFARLHELENVEFALFGGPSKHGAGAPTAAEREGGRAGGLPFPHRHVRQHEPARLAASGRYRAVVCSASGRIALGATWAGTRRAGLPLILWSALWAHPRSPAHALSFLALRRLYRSADAVVTYGPHVSAYVGARGARNVYIAPQAVDNAFWSAADVGPPRWPTPAGAGVEDEALAGTRTGGGAGRSGWPVQTATKFLFVGRPRREKGVRVLTEAWRTTGLLAPPAALVLVGEGSNPPWVPAGGAAEVLRIGPVAPVELRSLYAACDVLVVPSIATATFREPWGLVVNEAMNRGLPVIASDAVGAAAGGLVRDGRNGLVVPAGDSDALARAIRRLAADPELRKRLGETGARDVRAYTYDAWAQGFSSALASLGLSRRAR